MFENLVQEFSSQTAVAHAAGAVLKIILILLAAKVIVKLSRAVVERVFSHSAQTGFFGEEKRIQTLKTLLKSVVTYTFYFIASLMVLSTLGVNTTSILASAGILGLAVGFGAQNLVRDVITGFFIVFDNYFVVGDYINTADVGGIVEEIGLRTTRIRDWSGELHILPNSEITKVTNHCRGKMRAAVEIPLAPQEDIDRAISVLQEAADQVGREMADKIIDPPVVLGVQSLGPLEMVIRVVAFTKAMEQWSVERELRKRLKQAMDEAEIKISDPRRLTVDSPGREDK